MTWKRDTRESNTRRFGDIAIFSEVNAERETAHVIVFPDGTEIRVLPSDLSGRMRSLVVREVVAGLADASDRLRANEALLVAIGGFARVGLETEELEDGVPVACETCGRPM